MPGRHPIILTLIAVFLFTTCKKGEDDPVISLRSRTTRLTGEWRLVSGTAGYTTNGYNDTFSFTGTDFRENLTTAYLTTYIGKYILKLNIAKDGTFSFKEFLAGSTLDASGTWNFNNGIGEDKKKEDVIFTIDKVNAGYTNSYYNPFNRGCTNFVYKIKELRNAKLVIHSSGKVYSNSRADYVTLSTDYTFIQ